MVSRNKFIFLLVVAALLAILSLSLQFLHLIPSTPLKDERQSSKSRKRIIPILYTEPPGINPIYEAYAYCNIPNKTEHGVEGHSPPDFKLLSVQVVIRHGDRYPLYSIPKTNRPAIDCSLIPSRNPSHPQLATFIKHMSKPTKVNMDNVLSSLPRFPSHFVCEMGELTQTGIVQHLQNGKLLRHTYIEKHKLIPDNWNKQHLYVESTGKSRTLQSGLALLFGLLPEFDWQKVHFRHQWSTIFCASNCDCPMRNHYLEEEQRRQYNFRVKNNLLEQTYVDMARIIGIPTRQLRAANPIDSLLCHFCHNITFPCTQAGCISLEHFTVIKSHQLDDEKDRQEKMVYYKYSLLAIHPLLNQTVTRMQKFAENQNNEVFALYSAHDVTIAPLLNALGLPEARFPRFAARIVFELWRGPRDKKRLYIRILYNGDDVTFHTTFCRKHNRHSGQPLCPLQNFVNFVKKDMFAIFNSTNYYDACHRRVF
ncbi:2-phosphoxylose phosphatase 1 isoform X1 [Polypterus senegalus]|uniref:2-phosphoxylose phosphatase 1 isoform X1 n=1 Tax=Polypterus senegalus TaxID=55291 RepID=UPI0019666630|nr:2-phosphoxylose phosphatase 1 isoform X1 [Polypterus senegalus]